ncbi:MAG: hypothetical protein AAB113_04350 [Candidatus Eisenbacteria bacterium]
MVDRLVATVVMVTASGVAFIPRPGLAVRVASDSAGIVSPALDPPSPGSRMLRLIRADGRQFFTRRTAGTLLAGVALTGASLVFEDPDRTADLLGGRTLEHAADVGNFYGDGVTLGLGALALLAAGQVSGDANARAAGFEAAR